MLNSFPKYETRDLPGLKVYLERKGELPKGLVLGLAAIITYYKGYVRADGTKSEPNDSAEILQLLQNLWATGSTRQGRRRRISGNFHLGRTPEPHSGIEQYGKRFPGCH